MDFDVLIVGGGAAGMSCALILGSAKNKPFAGDKKIGIIMHQKASALRNALFNNVLGLAPGTKGKDVLESGKNQLESSYPHVAQIAKEKVLKIAGQSGNFTVFTNRGSYKSKCVVVAVGASNTMHIEGLGQYVEPHGKLPVVKKKIQLKNKDHLLAEGLFVAGVLAGWSSQFSIAAGSGASVATDILTMWNNGDPAVVHDAVAK